MLRLYTCLTSQHDLGLVVLAATVCLVASWTTVTLGRRCLTQNGRARMVWAAVAGVVAGSGIWTTHFVAMLAFNAGMPIDYDLQLTIISILVSVTGGTLALVLATHGGQWVAAGGACIGLNVVAMHYTGMAAVRFPVDVSWNMPFVLSSILLGACIGAASLHVGLCRRRRFAGSLLLVLAICSVHFTGMAGLQLSPLAPSSAFWTPAPAWWLAAGLVATTAIILGFALAGLMVDTHLVRLSEREETRLRTLANVAFEGILIHAHGTIVDVNESFLTMAGYCAKDLIDRSVTELFDTDQAGETPPIIGAAEQQAKKAMLRHADGRLIDVEILGRPIDLHARPAQVWAVRDISERRAAERRIHHLAFHDPLTGLANSRLFHERLQQLLPAVGQSGVAILCLDLDRFKVINDSYGHLTGDEVLRATARRLTLAARQVDLVARLGGDEFCMIQVGVENAEQVKALCRRLVHCFSEPFDVEGTLIVAGVSIGVAMANVADLKSDEALKRADLALYRAKGEGRGTWRFYETEMDEQVRARHLLELDLRQAILLDQLQVYYQPLIDVQSGKIIGFEALVRWFHPVRGSVSPADFIPVAEEIGLIDPIGRWVLQRACADTSKWFGDLTIAVNLSPAQFRTDGIVDCVAAILAATQLKPSQLIMEVTESLFIGDSPGALDTLHALRKLGVKIAMDDFGTGYSSLNYLRRFPFDKLKIDQAFIRDSGDTPESRAIVRAIVGLGHSLGMTVNAEGVETEGQLASLREESCDEVQGYLFSRPIPLSDVAGLLADHVGKRAASLAPIS